MDWLIDLSLAAILRLLRDVIKNPVKKAIWKKAMLKLRDTIDMVYGDEPEFLVEPGRVAMLQGRRQDWYA